MKIYTGYGGVTLLILNVVTIWKLVAVLTPRPLYPRGNTPRYQLRKRWIGRRVGFLRPYVMVNTSNHRVVIF